MVVVRIFPLVLAVMIGITGTLKVIGHRTMIQGAQHLGFSVRSFRLIGLSEWAAVLGLLIGLVWVPLGVAAAIGLVLLLIGAVIAHLRATDPFRSTLPAVTCALLAAAVIATA